MNWLDFAKWSKKIADWGADYHINLRDRPVRANVKAGDIAKQLPLSAPNDPEAMETILGEFDSIIMPGMTHWQHPRFFAYFNSNSAPPSMLAEQLANTVAAQCMLWQTSPAATELETRVLDWLRQELGLPDGFEGVIQDSASSATLAAVLTMRERALGFSGNQKGLQGQEKLRIYCSAEVHSSIDKAIWISGVGQENLVKISPQNNDLRSMDTDALSRAIADDLAAGFVPAGIIACTGATGAGSCDDINAVMDVADAHDLFVHVDAAWAGSAMICPEFRNLWAGVERVHSVVFNPHKWLGANFDCSAHFLRTPRDLVKTLAIQPEYLKTHGAGDLINYSEWSIPLGRRFRALKLWFLIRSYGMDALRQRLRNHVDWVQGLGHQLDGEPDFELVTQPILALFTFRYTGGTDLDALNLRLVNAINDDGRIYLTQTKIDGALVIRFTGCQFDATKEDVDLAFDVITQIARSLD